MPRSDAGQVSGGIMLNGVRCLDPGTIETPSKPVGRIRASGIGVVASSYSAATLSARPIRRVASGPQNPWVRRLGVVVEQQDPAAGLGQRAGEVVAGAGLADPAFLIQQADRDPHAAPSVAGVPPWNESCYELSAGRAFHRETRGGCDTTDGAGGRPRSGRMGSELARCSRDPPEVAPRASEERAASLVSGLLSRIEFVDRVSGDRHGDWSRRSLPPLPVKRRGFRGLKPGDPAPTAGRLPTGGGGAPKGRGGERDLGPGGPPRAPRTRPRRRASRGRATPRTPGRRGPPSDPRANAGGAETFWDIVGHPLEIGASVASLGSGPESVEAGRSGTSLGAWVVGGLPRIPQWKKREKWDIRDILGHLLEIGRASAPMR